MKPLPNVVTIDALSSADRERLERVGYEEIVGGKVAVLLMAGGQGTRLGCDDPKGMYDVGLLSRKTLFQLQAERLLCLEQLAADYCKVERSKVVVPWYIMTSFVTDDATKRYFEQHAFFGLKPSQFFFFNQDLFPCMDAETGRILMQSKFEIAIAPNGNGGLWSALHSSGALQDMKMRGIEMIASYGVDNILAKVADPVFIGFSKEQGTPISCKVVRKAHPEERVGVLCLRDGRPSVIEYSEIDPAQAAATDPITGTLLYNAAHIVLNNFTVDFVTQIVDPHAGNATQIPTHSQHAHSNLSHSKLAQLPYHIAKKKIPCIDDKGIPTDVMGWKFELFVFDVFEFADKLSAMEVVRAHEFSPLKNAVTSPSDNPITCRQHLSQLHQKWVTDAGGIIHNAKSPLQTGGEEPLFEVSPSISYSGEGLRQHVEGKNFTLPFHLHDFDQLENN